MPASSANGSRTRSCARSRRHGASVGADRRVRVLPAAGRLSCWCYDAQDFRYDARPTREPVYRAAVGCRVNPDWTLATLLAVALLPFQLGPIPGVTKCSKDGYQRAGMQDPPEARDLMHGYYGVTVGVASRHTCLGWLTLYRHTHGFLFQ